MRITHKRKRSNFTPRRNVKRKFVRRNKRSVGSTSKSSTGYSFGFKSRKVSRRSWNHKLWDSTLQKQHQRSNLALSDTFVPPLLVSQYSVHLRFALPNNVGNQFWTAGGGMLVQDVAQTAPVFNGDIILRGGIIGFRLCNDVADASPMTAVVYLIKTGDKFSNTNIPVNVFEGWDPTLVPDFSTDVGRIILKRKFAIENGNSADIQFRLPIQKIEQAPFTGLSNQYAWILLINNNQGVASTMTGVRYHNLSFAGDLI